MSDTKPVNTLASTLKEFEVIEANLAKLERLYKQISSLIPQGVSFGTDITYENLCRSYENILLYLPAIDGWKPSSTPMDLNTIAQTRLDAADLGEIDATISLETEIEKPGLELRKYRFLFNQKRKQLIRDAIFKLIDSVDGCIRTIEQKIHQNAKESLSMKGKIGIS